MRNRRQGIVTIIAEEFPNIGKWRIEHGRLIARYPDGRTEDFGKRDFGGIDGGQPENTNQLRETLSILYNGLFSYVRNKLPYYKGR